MISIGTGQRVPRTGDSLLSSTTMISRRLASATIFSRSSAPPPPLITSSCGSTSSAPSMVTSIVRGQSSSSSGMPAARAASAVALEVAKPTMSRSFPSRSSTPSRRVAKIAVLPVPRPTTMPDSTNASARSAAACFRAACGSSAIAFPSRRGASDGLTHDLLRFGLDAAQVLRVAEALRVDLVDLLGPRGARGEPAALGNHLQAADGLAVAGRTRQHLLDLLARQLGGAHALGRELGERRFLGRRRGRVDALVHRIP